MSIMALSDGQNSLFIFFYYIYICKIRNISIMKLIKEINWQICMDCGSSCWRILLKAVEEVFLVQKIHLQQYIKIKK